MSVSAPPPPVKSTDSEFCRWNSSSHVPSTTEPMTSAMMLPIMKIFSACRPARLTAVPASRITSAMRASVVPDGSSIPKILAANPAAPSATVAIAITNVHMYAQPANQP